MSKPVITVIGLCGQSVFLTMDHFHEEGETVHADSIYSEPGGKGYNQAVAAARLGADVSFIGCIGDDNDGKLCRDFLEGENVNALIEVRKNNNTAYAVILTDRDGKNRVTVYRGASDDLSEEFVRAQEGTIAQSDILLLNHECSVQVNNAAMEIAKRYGVKVILNPAPAREVSQNFADGCFAIVPNETEDNSLSCTCKNRIVTLGSNGADIVSDDVTVHVPAVKTVCVDSTGAGDCFCAAFAVAVGEGKSIEEAVKFAVKCSGLSVSKQYVMKSLPRREQIK